MSETKTAFCTHCKKEVSCREEKVVHWQQFLITLVTCGLWLPIWISLALSPTLICQECNEPIWKRKKETESA